MKSPLLDVVDPCAPPWHAANRNMQVHRLGAHVVGHLLEVLATAGPGETVLYLHVDVQHLVPLRLRGPAGTIGCWPTAVVQQLLRGYGAVRTALRLEVVPPVDHVWVVWLGRGCAVVAPWLVLGREGGCHHG